uniref:(northern house mosquito) hypothetical protein n=1 Tax=Culex pipiens TaxID=7175 RepID=A0A8D8AA43_CULPI
MYKKILVNFARFLLSLVFVIIIDSISLIIISNNLFAVLWFSVITLIYFPFFFVLPASNNNKGILCFIFLYVHIVDFSFFLLVFFLLLILQYIFTALLRLL